MAKYLSDIQKPVWIRHVLVPTINTDEIYLERLHQFIVQLKNVERVEVLPYHTLGAYKWKELGLDYPLEGIPTPRMISKTEMNYKTLNKLGDIKLRGILILI